MFLVASVGRIMDAANIRKKEALGASVMRRSATSNLTPKFRGRTRREVAKNTLFGKKCPGHLPNVTERPLISG